MFKINLQYFANKGLKYPCYAIATEANGAITYSAGAELSKGVSYKFNPTFDDGVLWGSDTIIATDKRIIGGTVTLGITHLNDALKVALLGYIEGAEIDAVTHAKELSLGDASQPSNIGMGVYGESVDDNNVICYRARWIKKVQFGHPGDERDTKTGKTAYKTPTLIGTIMQAADLLWDNEGTFSTEAGAIAWLKAKAGISSLVSTGLTALAFSNGTLTPAFGAAIFNYSCVATDAVAITATAAGVIKLYVDGLYNQTLTTTVAGVAVPMAINTNKIFQIVIQESGKAAITTTIVVQRAGA